MTWRIEYVISFHFIHVLDETGDGRWDRMDIDDEGFGFFSLSLLRTG